MNKEYIVDFSIIGNHYVSIKIKAENNELALNQAQGMIHSEWVNLVDIDGNSVRVRSDKVTTLRCYEANNSLGKTAKDRLIVEVEINMDLARLKYDEGGADYAERIEFADFYFKMSDILKELHTVNEYEASKLVRLKLEKDRAWSSLDGSVMM